MERTYRALLVGNSVYAADPSNLGTLRGPKNDVAAMASALSDADWGLHDPAHVIKLIDAKKGEIEREIETFFSTATPQDQLLFYFSGHGLQEVNERLFLASADAVEKLPRSTAVAMSLLNDLAAETRAAATAIIIDCCYSGIMKGASYAHSLDSRGRWILASSSRSQSSWDASSDAGCSAFTGLVVDALVGGGDLDVNKDGFVTMADIKRYVTEPLFERTGQDVTFDFQGSGDLVVALAPGYPVDVDQDRDAWLRIASGTLVKAPNVPSLKPSPDISAEDLAEGEPFQPLVATDMEHWTVEALEGGRDFALRRQLRSLRRKASQRVESNDRQAFTAELDGLVTMAAVFLDTGSHPWFKNAVADLVVIYEQGFNSDGFTKTSSPSVGGVPPAELWLSILDRVLALGGLAVRLGDWDAVKELALQRPDGYDFRYYNNWVRHALTEAARANLFLVPTDDGNGRREESAIIRAQRATAQNPSLRPDVEATSGKLLDSICQFDFLACLSAVVALGRVDSSAFYPDYARFQSHRTTPVIRKLLTDDKTRAVIAPIPDGELLRLLGGLNEMSQREGMRYSGWTGMDDPTINDWIDRQQ